MPESSRDFFRAAGQRLTAAEFLLEHGYNLDAMYLAGYTVECSLKALILKFTAAESLDQRLVEISRGSQMHQYETLNKILKAQLSRPIPLDLLKKLRRHRWSTSLRYEIRRIHGGEARGFLKVSRAIHAWVEEQLT